jgi:hypothetical protein
MNESDDSDQNKPVHGRGSPVPSGLSAERIVRLTGFYRRLIHGVVEVQFVFLVRRLRAFSHIEKNAKRAEFAAAEREKSAQAGARLSQVKMGTGGDAASLSRFRSMRAAGGS